MSEPYTAMVFELIEILVPLDRTGDIFGKLQASSEYMDAHGKFVYEEETYMDHFDSREILVNKIGALLEE